tara:strand:+ start:1112 stop:1885 length:774 start_codon:yes stop_codon:yes gene_type:complete
MVNIDTVYQRVLAIANKEQRGYITPLEFNLLANQAQMLVFEQYFYDRNKLADTPGNSMEYSDADKMIDEKIAVFSINDVDVIGGSILPQDLYRLGAVYHREFTETFAPQPAPNANQFKIYEAKLISNKEWGTIQNAPLLRPTNNRPVFIRATDGTITVFGSNNTPLTVVNIGGTVLPSVTCDYIAQPRKVEWGYDVVGEKALHNGAPNRTFHFQHHPSDETDLVYKVLELAGVIIEDQGIVQYANQKDRELVQKQKS